MANGDHLLTTDEVAEQLHIRPQTLRNWRLKGLHIPFLKIGRCVRYQKADVEAFILQGRHVSTSTQAVA